MRPPPAQQTPPRVILVGGGFAGVACAAELRRARPGVDVILFNAENHIVFTPLLAEVVGAAVNPLDVVVPLRQLLPGVHCRTEEVLDVDPAHNALVFRGAGSRLTRLYYDQLVLACGNVPKLSVVPGMADHAFPLKGIGDAVALRSHVLEQLERAETTTDPARRRWHLSFVVVGGGYSGVEAAGEINDLVRSSARYFRNFRAADASVTLVHSRDELLPEIGSGLRAFARCALERRGVRVVLRARVTEATVDGVVLGSGEIVSGATVVCTVGSSPSPLIEKLALPKERGRLLTEPGMRVPGTENVWAIGDCAQIANQVDGSLCAPTGQFAERQGRQCARNVLRALAGGAARPFAFRPIGQLCALGGRSAVAEIGGVRLAGFFAWVLWRSVYLWKMPSWSRRLQVAVDWLWLLWFPRDLAHIRARQTDRVSRAHYRPGDIILRPEDVPAHLLVIHSGEVEIDGGTASVMGASSFLGEKAFLGREPFGFTARARTAVEVMVMGRDVLTQLSASLAPLRNALATTLRRRAIDPWKTRPEAFAALRGKPVRELMDAAHGALLPVSSTLDDVGRAFAEGGRDFFCVCHEDGTLAGIVTLTDWARAASTGAEWTTPVQRFMIAHPIVVGASDHSAAAALLFREHELKHLPVVASREDSRVVGILRARRLLAHVYAAAGGAALARAAA